MKRDEANLQRTCDAVTLHPVEIWGDGFHLFLCIWFVSFDASGEEEVAERDGEQETSAGGWQASTAAPEGENRRVNEWHVPGPELGLQNNYAFYLWSHDAQRQIRFSMFFCSMTLLLTLVCEESHPGHSGLESFSRRQLDF